LASVLFVGLLAACNVEADFTLSRESRLPRWFTVGSDRLPNDAIVELIEYSDGTARMTLYRPAEMSALGVRGTKQSEVRGELQWHPSTLAKRNNLGGFDLNSYPHYMVMRVNGTFEILEFRRMEPVFYVSDDPELRGAVEPDRRDK
jgi:hypothetical protein